MPLPDYGKNPDDWTSDEVVAVARSAEYGRVKRYHIDLSKARSGALGNLEIIQTGLARYVRLSPESTGDVRLSVNYGTTKNSTQDDANFVYTVPGQARAWAFERLTIANDAQEGSFAVLEVSTAMKLRDVVEPAAAVGGGSQSVYINEKYDTPENITQKRLRRFNRPYAIAIQADRGVALLRHGADVPANGWVSGTAEIALAAPTNQNSGATDRFIYNGSIVLFAGGGLGTQNKDLLTGAITAEIVAGDDGRDDYVTPLLLRDRHFQPGGTQPDGVSPAPSWRATIVSTVARMRTGTNPTMKLRLRYNLHGVSALVSNPRLNLNFQMSFYDNILYT